MTVGKRTTADEIGGVLFRAAGALRGSVAASTYREYVAALLFLKWCSDNLPGGEGSASPSSAALYDSWRVPRASHWRALLDAGIHPEASLSRALLSLEAANPPLEGLFAAMGLDRLLLSTPALSRNLGLADAIQALAGLDLATDQLDPPDAAARALSDYLERLAGEWKNEMGSLITPGPVLQLLVALADPQPGMRVGDPACGTGGFLIEAARYVAAKGGQRLGTDRIELTLQGQEMQPAAWALARIIAVMSGLPHAELALGNVLTDPAFTTGVRLPQYDRVIGSPPFSLSNWGADFARSDPYERFWRVPPRNVGDYAFVQHARATLVSGGVAALLLLPGALFRTGAESEVRQWLVEDDVLDAVVSLPANLLFGTGIPPVAMVLRRGRDGRNRRVLLIDASAETVGQRSRAALGPANISRIVDTYRRFADVDGFAKAVTPAELAANGFNLQPERYLAVAQEPVYPPVDQLLADLRTAEADRDRLAAHMDGLIAQLRTRS